MRKTLILFFFFISTFTFKSVLADSDSSINTFVKDQYYKKLQQLDIDIPIFYNNNIRINILELLKNPKSKTSIMLGKANYAITHLGPYFDSLSLPKELALLSVVNSNFNTNYIDPSTGASGIWPMTYSVAKRYRLITNSYVDQRRNIELSSAAVAQYIYDLEQIYQDWHFVISAFYIGPINLNMAIRRAGNKLDYDVVHEVLTKDQRKSLEEFMALLYIYNFHKDHKLPINNFSIEEKDTVCTKVAMSIDFVADKMEIKSKRLADLNPDLIKRIIPDIENCNCFSLPLSLVEKYRENRDSIEIVIEQQVDSTGNVDSTVIDDAKTTPTGVPVQPKISNNPHLIYYTVKSGDNLGLLSRLFDCSIQDLKRWNNIKGTMLYAGHKIKVYVPSNKVDQYKKINSMTMAQKQAAAKRK